MCRGTPRMVSSEGALQRRFWDAQEGMPSCQWRLHCSHFEGRGSAMIGHVFFATRLRLAPGATLLSMHGRHSKDFKNKCTDSILRCEWCKYRQQDHNILIYYILVHWWDDNNDDNILIHWTFAWLNFATIVALFRIVSANDCTRMMSYYNSFYHSILSFTIILGVKERPTWDNFCSSIDQVG